MKAPPLIIYSILLISILVVVSGTASATNYYVSTSGDDTNAGLSPTTAWKTPSYAVSKVKAGDTVYLMEGTWYGEHLAFHTSGTKSAPITITSYNGKVVLDGVDQSDTTNGNSIGVEISDYSKGLEYINVNNIVIRNYYRGIYVRNSNNIHINGVEVYNTYYIGIDFIDTHESSLMNSNIHDNGWNSVSIVANNLDANNILLFNNRIHDNPGTSGGSGHNLIDLFNYGNSVSVNNIAIKNNYLYNGGSSSSAVFAHGKFTPMSNINFSNNIVYNTRQITLGGLR
jgi:hypothetical protein